MEMPNIHSDVGVAEKLLRKSCQNSYQSSNEAPGAHQRAKPTGPKFKKLGGAHFEPPKNGPRKGQLPYFISQPKLRLTCVNLRVSCPYLSYEPKRQLTWFNLRVSCSLLSIEPKLVLTWL